QITLPAFKYAQEENGRFVYYGDEARYFVTFNAPLSANGNVKVYATYREIATTVATEGDRVLAEGMFDAETKVELITTVNGYALKFTLNGEEVKADGVKIKFRPESGSQGCKVIIHSPDGTKRVCEETSGDCVVFTYSDGEYFTVETDDGAGIPSWGWALIGGASVAALAAVVFVTVIAVKKKKAKVKDGGKANEE
ncbi:MAG: hypothetical protein K2O67_01630, partial [Clostridia bacterium]|nr:hypothetical protein [Clostridia bacterium]